MKLSIVTTLYHSGRYVNEFYKRASKAASTITPHYEIIFVNDGSPDNSLALAAELAETDERVFVIDLSRNFGHQKAMMTGLAHAGGQLIFLIDSDLEEEPEWLLEFHKKLNESPDCDVVYGVQRTRKGGRFERWSGVWYYRILNLITDFDYPENMVTARLMTRRYIDALLTHEERETCIAGLWVNTGFLQKPTEVDKHSSSQTTYSLRRKLAMTVNSITSFSNTPLYAVFYLGIFMSLMSGVYSGHLIINWFFFDRPTSGWTSLMVSIYLMGGIVISLLGVLGIYLGKIFTEVKRRPYTIIRRTYGQSRETNQQDS